MTEPTRQENSAADLLPERLARAITLGGAIPLSQFMAAANTHYYATRDPLGARGDFTTAPEISQMFGELVGAWIADLWTRTGRPPADYVELGPGRGTLAADALRVMDTGGFAPGVHFVETSPLLRAEQAKRVPAAEWCMELVGLPDDRPLIVVANEFFDALPIRQLVKTVDGWRERLIACQDTLFLPVMGNTVFDPIIPHHLRDAAEGSILETSPQGVTVMRGLAQRIVAQGGAALVIDYGYEGPAIGETLQAVKGHAPANPFDAPGDADLTAHVDFATLAEAARAEGAVVHGPVSQGNFLKALGIDARAATLSVKGGEDVIVARNRLVNDGQMGDLFGVIAVTAPGWPVPAGFA
ncbi:class I SAM-dependent methyltransferase [Sphingomonas sp.]|uniref:class I SAM-dependent methyltransferase n=1 Tax=Sphingomonas sp. TaxID=28214 RepID=UPI002DD645E1|nr:SAM-dependent methyltransferase [Sphingomonas sp.]